MTEQQMWDSADVAQYLDLHRQTVNRMAARGELPGVKLGRAWRFRQEDIKRYLDRRLATSTPAQK